MQAKLVRRRHVFVRVDTLSLICYPVAAVVGLCIAGALLVHFKAVSSFYASPFVFLCAVVANRVCLRAGMITAMLSVLAHDYLFAAPYFEIGFPSREQLLAYASNFVVAYAVARRIPVSPSAPSDTSRPLPFTSENSDHTRTFWAVEASDGDDWAEDCAVGTEYGRIYVDRLRSSGPCPPLAWIVRDMIKRGRFGGVEAGFVGVLARAASARSQVYANAPDLSTDHHAHDHH